jgi:ribosomal small subunit protein bTHX
MGKGDLRTKKGKRRRGSYGNVRKKKKKSGAKRKPPRKTPTRSR